AGGDGGVAVSANLNVQGIAIDAQNNLYIADGINNRVREITPGDGVIDTIAGNGLASYSVQSVLVSGNTVYFSDGDNNRVRQFDLTTGETALLAGNGQATFAGDGSAATRGGPKAPRGLAMDSPGRIYIADSGKPRVRRLNADGTIATVAGT